jgi:hypothetical protein
MLAFEIKTVCSHMHTPPTGFCFISSTPVYVKAGGIVALSDLVQFTDALPGPASKLELQVGFLCVRIVVVCVRARRMPPVSAPPSKSSHVNICQAHCTIYTMKAHFITHMARART